MIVSYADAATFVGDAALATDAAFQAAHDAAEGFVRLYCRRQFDFARYTVRLIGGDQWSVTLPENIITLVEVRLDRYGEFDSSTIADLPRFMIDGRTLTSLDTIMPLGPWGRAASTVQVVFDGGYYDVDDVDPLHVPKMPADLRRAVMKITASEWRGGSGERFKSETLGEYSYTRETAGDAFPYDDGVRATLDEYACWV